MTPPAEAVPLLGRLTTVDEQGLADAEEHAIAAQKQARGDAILGWENLFGWMRLNE